MSGGFRVASLCVRSGGLEEVFAAIRGRRPGSGVMWGVGDRFAILRGAPDRRKTRRGRVSRADERTSFECDMRR